jgi:hypothetical protein
MKSFGAKETTTTSDGYYNILIKYTIFHIDGSFKDLQRLRSNPLEAPFLLEISPNRRFLNDL